MNFNHWGDMMRLVFRKTILSAGEQIFREAGTGSRKTFRRPLERGIWVRDDGDLKKQRLWLLFKDGRCVGIWGFVGYERGIKVNMEVSA